MEDKDARGPSASMTVGLWPGIYIAKVQSLLACGLDPHPGIEKVMGQTVEISEWLDFDFYDRVWYCDRVRLIARRLTQQTTLLAYPC